MPSSGHCCATESHISRSINDTWFNRLLVLTALRTIAHQSPKHGSVVFLTPSICIKYGSSQRLHEASTMQYIARNTTIPVPKVYCAFQRKSWTYIVMEKVKGKSIANGWKARSAKSQLCILQQLRNMVDNMRSLVPQSQAIANVDGGPLSDFRLPESIFGPFDSIEAFHSHLRGGLDSISDDLPAIVNELIALHQGKQWSAPVLTHGDLSSLNIIADGDIVTGIIDWESSGWYPEYWEYTTASQVNPRNEFWAQEVDKFLTPYPEELHMEELRRVYFGDT